MGAHIVRDTRFTGGGFTVPETVVRDHPDGYQYIAAVGGQQIPMSEAVALGLVDADGGEIVTAEKRRAPRARKSSAKKAAAKREGQDGAGGDDAGGDGPGDADGHQGSDPDASDA